MGHYSEVIDELKEPTRSLSGMIPETWRGFGEMHKNAVADGALPARIKELMALTIAVVKQCDGCIAYHAKADGTVITSDCPTGAPCGRKPRPSPGASTPPLGATCA